MPHAGAKDTPCASSSKRKVMDEGEVVWSDILVVFEGEGNITSLWDKRFPVKGLIREKLLTFQ